MKIALLISGGVDSSVALYLLKEQGYDVDAFYLKIWLEDELSYLGECPWEEDLSYVKQICDKTGTTLHIIPMQKNYWDKVVSYTIKEIKKGYTPNPDIMCNSHIKFGVFLDEISDKYQYIATGHYAKKLEEHGNQYLIKTPDPVKDQTYFLAYLKQAQLRKAIFPISSYTKKEIRGFADIYDLPNKTRKDSQGICFLGKIKFRDFILYHLGEKKGDIIELETNKKMGEHPGFWFYTIGQRHGLKLSGGPFYVTKKDTEKNIVYISKTYKPETSSSFYVSEFNWIPEKPVNLDDLTVKVRHGPEIYGCKLQFTDKDTGYVELDRADQGIAPGQFAVFYDQNLCLGGGIIQKNR